jgi:hypothetical protein
MLSIRHPDTGVVHRRVLVIGTNENAAVGMCFMPVTVMDQ